MITWCDEEAGSSRAQVPGPSPIGWSLPDCVAVTQDGSGNGEAMAANRQRGVRCAVAWNEESARLSRAHNDANVLSLGQRLVPEEQVVAIVDVWLSTPLEAGRHVTRIVKLDQL